MTIPIKPAATVILMREEIKGDFEIFMVKRSSRSTFGSLYVFPGGKLDPEDSENDLYPYCEGMNNEEASKQLGIKDNGLSFWIACIRECFEEVGVLLTNPDDSILQDTNKLTKLRKELNNKEITFKEICVSESLRLRTKNIVPCAHWITPDIETKRFDTRFFLAKVNAKQLASHDGFELTESFWIKPADALAKLKNGEMNMILPTIKNIEKLAEFSSSTEAFNYFEGLGDNAIPPILPKFIKKDGEWVGFLPGEEGYENV
ncbi:MAG: NUDIX hydrolase [Gammaproteobacteria bacterium]|jgi:8-oxo-dGTP pyrophosphatase MutT (NUDIX family)|tara:strand:+ start:1089 stop:1868 length:780 start_codon:yes stop_codon:yes gene_type:complete